MRITISLFSALTLATVILFATATSTDGQETPHAKAARLLNESKVKFTKIEDGIWTVPFEGKQLKDFNVVVAADKTYLLMFVTVSNQKRFRSDPELLKKLLAQNDEFDRVKIGIDKAGDIAVRVDLSMRLVDKQEFLDTLNQTAAAADLVYGAVIPYLNPGN